MSEEMVLVFPAHLLDEADFWKGIINVRHDPYYLVDRYDSNILHGDSLTFRPRSEVEEDCSVKQLIPYLVLEQNGKVFAYQRNKKGTESRLHDKWSIGVGGHINPVDAESHDLYNAALYRELFEELSLKPDDVSMSEHPSGVLYDSSNSVGRVHVGFIHIVEVKPNKKMVFEDTLINGQWLSPSELIGGDRVFENWSQLVIDSFYDKHIVDEDKKERFHDKFGSG